MEVIDKRRIQTFRERGQRTSAVVYWMSRDQRVQDNWALLFTRRLAGERNVPFTVVFTLVPGFLGATGRQYGFMLGGLKEVESNLQKLGIPFHLLLGDPPAKLAHFVEEHNVGAVVSDFDPLRIKRQWKEEFLNLSQTDFFTVDAHNIVPAFVASQKQEYGAYTLRPKIHRQLESFLVPFPELRPPVKDESGMERFGPVEIDWEQIRNRLSFDADVPEADWLQPGENPAKQCLNEFIHKGLGRYGAGRNDPNADATSNLSPYLHFGHISAQRVALEILKERPGDENTSAFLEELIVRRELSDNYCLYNASYDTLQNIPDWSRKTLEEHRRDEREYMYELPEFEKGNTHEDLWNAAQMEMVKTGKMHGYMRMYWAKKILEWTASPERAMETAVYLNDRYQLDGRDPNGYTGCAWSIAGIHDRAWAERPVFGKIRYMNENGCRRKFDVDAYIQRWQ